MKLLLQPGSGIAPLLSGIKKARSSVQIMIFRFDRREIEKALIDAVGRGVSVQALIAYTNRGGEQNLRDLEMRLLESGITVTRTAGDLVRYHAKMMIIDKREAYILGFNFAFMDIERSRSFGVITTNAKIVREAVKLFEADVKRQPYEPGCAAFVVSPENARQELSAFINGAKRELLVYDPKIADRQMIRLLEARAAAGVDVRVIGKISRNESQLPVHQLDNMRLHTRSMIRDGKIIFVGSQSLRTAELEARREAGIVFSDAKHAARMRKIFEEDWASRKEVEDTGKKNITITARKVAKKFSKRITKNLGSVGSVLADIVQEVVGDEHRVEVDPVELEHEVRDRIHEVVQELVENAVEEHQ